jgi:Pyocin activator protein PrtN
LAPAAAEEYDMNTVLLSAVAYDGLAVIPLDLVCRDYFRRLTVEKLTRKVLAGEIDLPNVRMEGSQKAAKGVHVDDLAQYLDRQAEAARRECAQLRRGNAA